jgi:1-acyl-sn-glycerol-3-phosphate acyltransferase
VREPVEELFSRYSWPAVRILKAVVGTAARAGFRLRTEAMENVPGAGPAILAANHVSLLDAPLIEIVVRRRVTYLAKAEYWDKWSKRWAFNLTGQIPVQRDTADASDAVTQGLRVLAYGGLLGLHPEGTRSPDGRLYRAKTGVARLAAGSGAPVIPIGVVGSLDVLPKGKKVPRFGRTITARFDEPMWFPTTADPDDADAHRAFADDVTARIAALTGQEICDEYNDGSSRRHRRVRTRRGRTRS